MDIAEIDAEGMGLLFYGNGDVTRCELVEGQPDVYLLEVKIHLERDTQKVPAPGQFYMLKSFPSGYQYNRPISVYHSAYENCVGGGKNVFLQFMILRKGQGTTDITKQQPGDKMTLLGPCGNTFEVPSDAVMDDSKNPEICIVGGGIGVAPVSNFAASLPENTYDFYASFKTGAYGLGYLRAKNLVITTDDGSVGIKGMLPVALSKEVLQAKGYKYLFACGPLPMLAYLQKVCMELGIKCFMSMEHRMLCGIGACLGCTINTKKGIQRVCKDGPVFDGEILEFPAPPKRRQPLPEGVEPDLRFNFKGVEFKNPVIASAGTFAYGQNYRGLFDVSRIGGISSKGVTFEPREGNKGERCLEVVGGNMNSIGLQNPGIMHYIEHELPALLELDTVTMCNLAGSDLESYVESAKLLEKTKVPAMELNISCPNVKGNGAAWGVLPESAFTVVSAVRKVFSRPITVKLGPDCPDIKKVAMACIEAGCDGLSLINMYHAVAIDIENERPFFNNVHAGFAGPAIKPLALRIVYDVYEEMCRTLPEEKRVPIFGIGGISSWKDAVEYIMAGASAVEIGAAKFANPNVMLEIIDGLKDFMKSHGYKNLDEMRGKAHIFMPIHLANE